MPEVLITYNYIKDLVVSYCKSEIYNLSGNDRRPAYYKNGNASYDDRNPGSHVALRFARTTSNSVVLVEPSTIENDMNTFLVSNLGFNASQLSKPINDKNYMNYVIDLAIFYATKVGLMTSNNYGSATLSSTTPNDSIAVYMPSNNTFNNLRPIDFYSIDMDEGSLTLQPSDIITQIQAVINTIPISHRTVSNKINFDAWLR